MATKILVISSDLVLVTLLTKELAAQYLPASSAIPEEEIEEIGPDIIILDMMMPGYTGLEVASKIRHQFREIPVIVLTSWQAGEGMVRIFDKHMKDYLGTPFPASELKDRIAVRLELNIAAESSGLSSR